jgi:hypothetical protein
LSFSTCKDGVISEKTLFRQRNYCGLVIGDWIIGHWSFLHMPVVGQLAAFSQRHQVGQEDENLESSTRKGIHPKSAQ